MFYIFVAASHDFDMHHVKSGQVENLCYNLELFGPTDGFEAALDGVDK